jgi:hypothetical protein
MVEPFGEGDDEDMPFPGCTGLLGEMGVIEASSVELTASAL